MLSLEVPNAKAKYPPFGSGGLFVLRRTEPLVSCVRGTRFLETDCSTGSKFKTRIS